MLAEQLRESGDASLFLQALAMWARLDLQPPAHVVDVMLPSALQVRT